MRCEKLHLKDRFSFLEETGCDPVLELYLPYNMTEMNRQDQKRPCMVVCPGGGYGMVSQREAEPIALQLLPEGFNVFVLTYSVAPHRCPTQLLQVAAVMELIYENAEQWNCDTGKIAIMGFSAGGHLAAHYSVCHDCEEVRKVFPDSKPVNASVLCYPVITADPAYSQKLASFKNLLGYTPQMQEEVTFFSCEKQVSKKTPPAFLWHTAEDACVPVNHCLLYAQALAQNGVPFELHIYPHGQHGLSTVDEQTCDDLPENLTCIRNWLKSLKIWLKQTLQ